MPSSRERIAIADIDTRSVRRADSIEAIGARSRGCTCWSAPRTERKPSSQVTSVRSTSTWRRFQPMPNSSTARITALSTGFAAKAVRSCAQTAKVTTATKARNPSIRHR